MPRRRGEYALVKSTSFTLFPVLGNINSKEDANLKKTKQKLTNSGSTSVDYTFISNIACKELSSVSKENCKERKIDAKLSDNRGFCKFFLRSSSDNHQEFWSSKSSQNRTSSYDSFRNPLKNSLGKIKLRATSRSCVKQETTTSSVKVISVMNLKSDNCNGHSRDVQGKMHKSKSGALIFFL
ncbi:unnamed protein product [Thelazia callipaeda]|uniref:CKK domain-containing protein n=1 Tax=Thelazia callipaeda TaxID=103827 RepID=A0A0N5CPD6_THECL|nr:unnamed protein product [Thelazia callipaeda]